MKKRSKSIPSPKEPRSLDEIGKEYGDIMNQVARAQYLAFIHSRAATQLNERLAEINTEADRRTKLDAAAADSLKAQEAKEKDNVTTQRA